MKREFLQNFKVGDQALPKEVIDAIMAENGRDIEEAKKPKSSIPSVMVIPMSINAILKYL